jgi:methylglutaconyl-CoA hydratase
MLQKTIKFENDNQVAQLTLNRPEVHNAFNHEMIKEMIDCFEFLKHQPTLRLLFIEAEGSSFCAGADLNDMQKMIHYSFDDNQTEARNLAYLFKLLSELPQVTIAFIKGAAYGGGVGLAAACDLSLASPEAIFCLSEVKLGLIPAIISPYVIRSMGARQAQRYFLTAETLTSEAAYRIGLIHEVIAETQWTDRKKFLIQKITQNAPQAIMEAKHLIRKVSNAPLNSELIEYTINKISELRVSKEGQEGLNAFLEKRKPAWFLG